MKVVVKRNNYTSRRREAKEEEEEEQKLHFPINQLCEQLGKNMLTSE